MNNLLTNLYKYSTWAFDTETTEEHFIKAKLRGISFYFQNGDNFYYNYEKDKTFLEKLKPFFESDQGIKIGHELKYDMHILKNTGIEVNGQIYDTKVAYWLIDCGNRDLGLKQLTPKELGIEMVEYKNIDKANEKEFEEYAKLDAKVTFMLYQKSNQILEKQGMLDYFYNTEMEFLRVLLKMERKGIALNLLELQRLEKNFTERLVEYEHRFMEMMFPEEDLDFIPKLEVDSIRQGCPVKELVEFNIQSGRHLATLFYKIKQYPIVAYTDRGSPAVHEGAISELVSKGYRELVPLLKYKGLQKLLTTYIKPFLEEHNHNGRIYPFYKQHGTVTGRLSGKAPNPQNIPDKSEEGQAVRACLVPTKGYQFIDSDFSQLELRIAAHWSGDRNLIQAFNSGKDVIDAVEEQMFDGAERTKESRTLTKAGVYGSLYLGGPRRLSEEMGVEMDRAKKWLYKYYRIYKDLRKFQLTYPLSVRNNKGLATTLFKRQRLFLELTESKIAPQSNFYSLLTPKIYTKDSNYLLHKSERDCLSFRVQGTASDIMKQAMILADRSGIKMVAQVHDELLVETDNPERDMPILERCMKDAVRTLRVPLEVKSRIINKWTTG